MAESSAKQSDERDVQKQLDVVSVSAQYLLCITSCVTLVSWHQQSEVMKEVLACSGVVHVMASEEEDGPIQLQPPADSNSNRSNSKGFAVVFDPLDGSRNIEVSIPTG